jgi:DNA-binding response OmpR family regulator
MTKPFSPAELTARVKSHISRYERLKGRAASPETISHRHFRRLLEIESELLREEDETKRLKLERLRIWNQRVYKAKVKQIRTMELNLSHSELGNLLGIPKGTIDSSVHYMKHLLLKCMDEQGDNEYL